MTWSGSYSRHWVASRLRTNQVKKQRNNRLKTSVRWKRNWSRPDYLVKLIKIKIIMATESTEEHEKNKNFQEKFHVLPWIPWLINLLE